MGKVFDSSEPNRPDNRYWLYEDPIVYETGKNSIRYFEQARKIQFAKCDYVRASMGYRGELEEERRPGKLSALDLDALAEDPETLNWLISILQELII